MSRRTEQLIPGSQNLDGKRVLVVGYRQPIVDVLKRLAVPFAVWHHRPLKRNVDCLHLLVHEFPSNAADIRQLAEQQLKPHGPFSEVIAGTEGSVYAASVCRRVLGSRKSKDSIALRCSDKLQMKSLMKEWGIPMTDFLPQAYDLSAKEIFDQLGPKIVVKERKNSGGRGISMANNVADLTARKDRGLIYERFIAANELSVESFIRSGEISFTSVTNYLIKTQANIIPANLPENVLRKALELNQQVVNALDLNWGLTHAEFYWNEEQVLFGEVALRPPGGYIMECMSLAHEFDAWEAFVANELDLSYAFPASTAMTGGVVMLHAGEGKLTAVRNVDVARQLPSCVRLKVLVKPGQQVAPRIGVSDISAYGLFVSNSPESTTVDVLKCLELIKFDLEPMGDENIVSESHR